MVSSLVYERSLIKRKYHDIWGGSMKHDALNEMFESGWIAALEAVEYFDSQTHADEDA